MRLFSRTSAPNNIMFTENLFVSDNGQSQSPTTYYCTESNQFTKTINVISNTIQ